MESNPKIISNSRSIEIFGLEIGSRCLATQGLSTVMNLALFIIGCVGASGAFPGATIGWVTAGLGTGSLIFDFLSGRCVRRCPSLTLNSILTMVFVIVGVLGGVGILGAKQVGWGIIGTRLASVPFRVCASCCNPFDSEKEGGF